MRIKSLIFVCLGMCFFCSSLYPATFNGKRILKGRWMGKEIEYVEGDILFRMKSGAKLSALDLLFKGNGAKLAEGPDILGMGRLEVSSSTDIFTALRSLNASSLVEFAEPNLVDRAMYPPNDNYFNSGEQSWLNNYGQNPPNGTAGADIHVTSAWDISPGSSDVLLGILDSGIPLLT